MKVSIIGDGPTSVDMIESDSTIDNEYYDLKGRRVEKPTPGIYIHDGKKVLVK